MKPLCHAHSYERPARARPARLRRIAATLSALALIAAWSAADEPRQRAERHQTGRRGMVVAVCPLAAGAGFDAIARGGNAVDATVATALALAVTWPEAGNIGGGGFMLVRPSADREPIVIDYREVAPLGASADLLARDERPSQYKLVAVPGTVAGLAAAHARFGKLPWSELVMPAVRLAEEGFTVSQALAESLNEALAKADDFAEFRRVYGNSSGQKSWGAGDRLRLPELGATLRRIADEGINGFYGGLTAERLEAEMTAGGGLVSKEDLRRYRPKFRQPIHGTFRGYHVYSAPPPSSGGIALVEMLNILENFPVEREDRYSARTLHLMVESMRRAYCDRARHLGDPDFTDIPSHLTSKPYAKKLAGDIDLARATPSAALAPEITIAPEGSQTTHFSIVDGSGMAVANTYTLEQSFGSKIVVRGGGFLLNNEMGDFNRRPGVTDAAGRIGTPANQIAPAKRMLSSMTPTIVTAPDGQTLLVTGSPGGRTIINTVACVVLNVLAFDMPPVEAVEAPRLHHQWLPDRVQLERGFFDHHAEALASLREMGHAIRDKPARQGDAHTIWVDRQTGTLHGIADPRRAGAARGE